MCFGRSYITDTIYFTQNIFSLQELHVVLHYEHPSQATTRELWEHLLTLCFANQDTLQTLSLDGIFQLDNEDTAAFFHDTHALTKLRHANMEIGWFINSNHNPLSFPHLETPALEHISLNQYQHVNLVLMLQTEHTWI